MSICRGCLIRSVGSCVHVSVRVKPHQPHSHTHICGMTPPLYVNVPAQVVREVIEKHLGIDHRFSGALPTLATAADMHPPSDLSTEESHEGSPTSMVHVGAPPPPPPPIPQLGGLPPPQQLVEASMSPILRSTTREEDKEI